MARPRKFDETQVLQSAMELFWACGYAGTSLDALDKATGLNRGSVYNAFGDKRHLYLATIDHYGQAEFSGAAARLRGGGPASAAIPALFDSAVDAIDAAGAERHGCFVCNASTERAPVDPLVATKVTAWLDVLRTAFARSLAKQFGVGNDEHVSALSNQLVATYMGLQVMAKAGCTMAQLRALAAGVRHMLTTQLA